MLKELQAVESVATKGPLAILDIIPSWLWALVVAALLAGISIRSFQVLHAREQLAESKQALAEAQAGWATAARLATDSKRAVEQFRSTAKEKVDEQVASEHENRARDERAGDERRSVLIAATAQVGHGGCAGGSGADKGCSDSEALARAEQRAAAFGGLLGRCDAVAARLGHSAEELATQVRGLQRQYDSLSVTAIKGGLGLKANNPLGNGM